MAINVLRYDPKEHYSTLFQWYSSRNLGVFPEDCLPKIGFVAENEDCKLAMVFIYQTDSAIAYMENFSSNPGVSKEITDSALDLVVKAGLEFAKKEGFRLVIGGTKIKAVAERAQKLGFILDEKPYFYTYFKIGE